jgi:hypothetical protein
MQCFQKDPNLRVSARKLLKHPWIVSARRSEPVVPKSDAVVPKKPTEYEEAIKSVQQWNEALKSPNAGSLRRTSRPNVTSPVPSKRERPAPLKTPGRGLLNPAKSRAIAEQFQSPNNNADDNWDDDFTSEISPSALQLPHLRPQDYYSGMLSSEKLKTYATFETVTEETNWDGEFEGDLTVKSPMQLTEADPLQTIRPYYPSRADTFEIKHTAPTRSPPRKSSKASLQETIQTPAQKSNVNKARSGSNATRTTLLYQESPIEDYSDLVEANDGAFEGELTLSSVRSVYCTTYVLQLLTYLHRKRTHSLKRLPECLTR